MNAATPQQFAPPLPAGRRLKTSRSLALWILLTPITLGIYDIIFFCGISNDLNRIASRYDSRRTMHYIPVLLLTPLTLGIMMLVWNHRMCGRIGDELHRRGIHYSFGAGTFWIWVFLVPVIGYFVYIFKLAKSMNKLSAHYNDELALLGAQAASPIGTGTFPQAPQASAIVQSSMAFAADTPAPEPARSSTARQSPGAPIAAPLTNSPKTARAAINSGSTLFCPICGSSHEEGDTFCQGCGQKLDIPSYTSCTTCGQMLNMTATFCEFCGNKVGAAAASKPPVSTYQTPVMPRPAPAANTYQAPVIPQSAPPAYPGTLAQPPAQPVRIKQTIPRSGGQSQPPQQQTLPGMPLIFVIDTSASAASYINELMLNLSQFVIDANTDSQVQSTLDMAIIQFNDVHEVLRNFPTASESFMPHMAAVGNAHYTTPIREAIRMACGYAQGTSRCHKPWIVMIASGLPADDIAQVSAEISALHRVDTLRFMALGVLDNNSAALKSLTDVVFRQKGTDFTAFFEWIRKCISVIVRTQLGEKPQLPQLEGNVYRDK